jgi:hypothetical protein
LATVASSQKADAWDDDHARAIEGVADVQTLAALLSLMLAGFPRPAATNAEAYVAAALLAIGDRRPSEDIVAAAIASIAAKTPPTKSGSGATPHMEIRRA